MTTVPAPAAARKAPRWMARAFLAVVLLAAVLVAVATMLSQPQEVAAFERPDHRYKVILMRKSAWWRAAMPGQSGDAPGLVRLYDRSGHLLDEAPVEMVQIVDGVEWQDHRVVIKLVADWALPD